MAYTPKLTTIDSSILTLVLNATKIPKAERRAMLVGVSSDAREIGEYFIDRKNKPRSPALKEAADEMIGPELV